MPRNESTVDRWVRVVLAVMAGAVGLAISAGTILGGLLLVVAAVLLITAATGFCPLYRLVGLSTQHGPAAREPVGR